MPDGYGYEVECDDLAVTASEVRSALDGLPSDMVEVDDNLQYGHGTLPVTVSRFTVSVNAAIDSLRSQTDTLATNLDGARTEYVTREQDGLYFFDRIREGEACDG